MIPSLDDDYLREGANAFPGKDYHATHQIFRALLIRIGNADIDLGHHEVLDEVLGVDVAACAAQYVVSVYMTSTRKKRAEAVRSAIDEMRSVGDFWEPLRELERVCVEPLPEFDDFLVRWRAPLQEGVGTERQADWDSDEDRWVREVVLRQGAEGLAAVAPLARLGGDEEGAPRTCRRGSARLSKKGQPAARPWLLGMRKLPTGDSCASIGSEAGACAYLARRT